MSSSESTTLDELLQNAIAIRDQKAEEMRIAQSAAQLEQTPTVVPEQSAAQLEHTPTVVPDRAIISPKVKQPPKHPIAPLKLVQYRFAKALSNSMKVPPFGLLVLL